MELLTHRREGILALGMMLADPASGLSSEIRRHGLFFVYENHVPPESWKKLIRIYLAERERRKAEESRKEIVEIPMVRGEF